MGLFSKRKPGVSSYQYNKRYGGFKNKAQHVFNTHNSHSVASSKMKIWNGGLNTLTSDGLATPKELNTYIASLEDTKLISKHEASDLRKVFGKELAKKDLSSKGWSILGRPKGISETRLEHDTFGSRSIDHQIYSGLSGHDKVTRNKLADAIRSTLKAAAQGGQGSQYGVVTKREVDSTIAYTETMPGYTARDRNAIKNILYRALGEKPSTTPTSHPLSTGIVPHKKTAQLGVTPPPVDGVEKNTPTKTPIMHAPRVVKGVHVGNAAEVPLEIQRALVDIETNVSSVMSSSAHEGKDGADTSHEKTHHKHEDDDVHTDSKHDTHHTQTHKELIQATTPHSTQPLSSRSSFEERIARQRAERSTFNQYEQSTTQLTRASHESLTEKPAPLGKSGETAFQKRLKKRLEKRDQLNQPAGAHTDTHNNAQTFHAPSFHSHTTFDTPSKGTPDSAHDTEEGSTPKPSPAQHISSTSYASSTHSFTPSRQGHDEHGQVEHTTENQGEIDTPSHDEVSEAPHMSFTPHKTSTHIPTPQEQKPDQEPGEQQNLESANVEHQETEVENHDVTPTTVEYAEANANASETQPEQTISDASNVVTPEKNDLLQQETESSPTQEEGLVPSHEEKQKTNNQSEPESKPETESVPSTSMQTEDTTTTHRPAMKFHLPHLPTQDTESELRETADEEQASDMSTNPTVEFTTNLGAIAIELFITDMPNTAGHILALAKRGAYTGTKFHRVVADYVLQAGEGVGSSGASTVPRDEPKEPHSNMRGAVSLVSADKNAGGAVFSINVVNNVVLDGRYPVFGKVIAGMDVVDAIAKVPIDNNEVPKTPIVIESVTVS